MIFNHCNLYTDGSCNSKQGSWAFILERDLGEVRCFGIENRCGPNFMELLAILSGVEFIQKPSIITIYTDSWYVISGMRKKKCGEHWERLLKCNSIHKLIFVKVGKNQYNSIQREAHHLARKALCL